MNCAPLHCFTLWCFLSEMFLPVTQMLESVRACRAGWAAEHPREPGGSLCILAMNFLVRKKCSLWCLLSVSLKGGGPGGGRPKGCCARGGSLFSFAEDAAFPAWCCGFAGVRWPEGCRGGLVPAACERGDSDVSIPQDKGWGKAFSVC